MMDDASKRNLKILVPIGLLAAVLGFVLFSCLVVRDLIEGTEIPWGTVLPVMIFILIGGSYLFIYSRNHLDMFRKK